MCRRAWDCRVWSHADCRENLSTLRMINPIGRCWRERDNLPHTCRFCRHANVQSSWRHAVVLALGTPSSDQISGLAGISTPRPAAPARPTDYGIRVVNSDRTPSPTVPLRRQFSVLLHDSLFAFGMTGVGECRGRVMPPIVSITNPMSATVFAAPAYLTFAATASARVDSSPTFNFWPMRLFWATSPPLLTRSSANSLAAADYTFSAVAADNGGLTATNAVPITLSPRCRLSQRAAFCRRPRFPIQLSPRTPGLNYIVQRSSNLIGGQLDDPRHQPGGRQFGDFSRHKRDGQSGVLSRRPVAESVIRRARSNRQSGRKPALWV